MTNKTDIVIIGAGPAGLFAVFECGMMKMQCHVVDTLDFIGGQCTALYPEKPIYDVAGFPKIDAGELIENLKKQAAPFNPVYHLGQQVVSLDDLGEENEYRWKVKTSKDTEINCKAIIIAAGCGAFGPNRPPLQDIERFEETGSVAYMVGKKEDFRDKDIVVAGGGDSAVDWALSLSEVAKSLKLVHRRAKFRAAPESINQLDALVEQGKIELIVPYQLKGLQGDENHNLTEVIVADLDGNIRELEADILLPFYGLAMDLGPIANWGLSISKQTISVEQVTCKTNIDSIYAIGDIANYEHKLKLITCGFAEASQVARAIYPLIYPDKAYHFEYSTTSGVPA